MSLNDQISIRLRVFTTFFLEEIPKISQCTFLVQSKNAKLKGVPKFIGWPTASEASGKPVCVKLQGYLLNFISYSIDN